MGTKKKKTGRNPKLENQKANPAKKRAKIPDWKNPNDYLGPKITTGEQWAWEFLRRNPEYRQEYKSMREAYANPPYYGQMPVDPPPLNGETESGYYARMEVLGVNEDDIKKRPQVIAEKYGLIDGRMACPCDPEETDYTNVGFKSTPRIARPWINKSLQENSPEEFIFKFYLSKPYSMQQAIVKNLFMKEQKKFEARWNREKPKTYKFNKALFPVYLRILDAVEAKASMEEIGVKLFPTLDDHKPTYQRRKRVSETLEAAKRIRDSEYKHIPQNFPV